MPPVLHEEKCVKCGQCVSICPMQVFTQTEPETVPTVRYPEECWHCNACVLDCNQQALSLRLPLNYMILHVDAERLRPR